MHPKEKNRLSIGQKVSHLRTDLTMFENGLKTVGTKENSNLWINYLRKEVFELQTLSDQYHEITNQNSWHDATFSVRSSYASSAFFDHKHVSNENLRTPM